MRHFWKAWLVTCIAVVGCAALGNSVRGDEPPSARQLYAQAASSLLAKNIAQATSDLERLIESHPDDDLAPLAALRLAECHLSLSRWSQAITLLQEWLPKLERSESARKLQPGAATKGHLLLARAHWMQKDYALVQSICQQQIERYAATSGPGAPERQALDQFEALARQAKSRRQELSALQLRQAADCVGQRKWSDARQCLQQVKTEELDSAWAWRHRVLTAQCDLGENRPSAAMTTLKQVSLQDLSDAEKAAVCMLCLDAAIASGALMEADSQLQLLSRLVSDDPVQAPVVALRAIELAMLRKDRVTADRLARQARDKFSDYPGRYEFDLLLARNLLARIEFDEARKLLQQIIDSPPTGDNTAEARARWLLGESYFLSRDYPRAIEEYSQVIGANRSPLWTESALVQRGKCYELIHQTAAALSDYQRLIEVFPNSALAPDARRRIEQATADSPAAQTATRTIPTAARRTAEIQRGSD